jgi:hypothetical protein
LINKPQRGGQGPIWTVQPLDGWKPEISYQTINEQFSVNSLNVVILAQCSKWKFKYADVVQFDIQSQKKWKQTKE